MRFLCNSKSSGEEALKAPWKRLNGSLKGISKATTAVVVIERVRRVGSFMIAKKERECEGDDREVICGGTLDLAGLVIPCLCDFGL